MSQAVASWQATANFAGDDGGSAGAPAKWPTFVRGRRGHICELGQDTRGRTGSARPPGGRGCAGPVCALVGSRAHHGGVASSSECRTATVLLLAAGVAAPELHCTAGYDGAVRNAVVMGSEVRGEQLPPDFFRHAGELRAREQWASPTRGAPPHGRLASRRRRVDSNFSLRGCHVDECCRATQPRKSVHL